VLVNESGMHTSMDRLRLRAPEGEQTYSEIPRNRGKNLTLIASVRRELVEERGVELVFLPSYSSHLNPIAEAFSKVKNVLRKLGAPVHEAVLEAMEEVLLAVTPGDVAGW
jgi:transposase